MPCEPPNIVIAGECIVVDAGGGVFADGQGASDFVSKTDTKAADTASMNDTTSVDGTDTAGSADTTIEDQGTSIACVEDSRECFDTVTVVVCKNGEWVEDSKCPGDLQCVEGYCITLETCTPGEIDGCYNSTSLKQCTEGADGFVPVPCEPGQFCFKGTCGSKQCEQGETKCISPSKVGACSADGTTWDEFEDCGTGAVCVGGVCQSGCDALVKYNLSYIGCEYWSVDLDQYDDPFSSPIDAPYGIVVSNPGLKTVNLQFIVGTGAPVDVVDPTVPPKSSRAFVLPSLNDDNSGITKKSVRVLSDRPVSMHQFNPMNNDFVYSNDASLLLPVHAIGMEYYIVSWTTAPLPPIVPGILPQRGYFTVVAVAEGETKVVVESTAKTMAGPGVAAMNPGDKQEFSLQQFDVLTVSADGTLADFNKLDLTGTHVYSNQPIVVFGGHEEAVIGNNEEDNCCAEHLEEQLFPVASWRSDVLCVKTRPRGNPSEDDLWRIVAGPEGALINTIPPIAGLHGVTLGPGKWVEVFTDQSFEVQATGPIMVAQYTVGQAATMDFIGDPSMILAVPQDQYRDEYIILTPQKYTQDFVTVIRPAGAQIMVDDQLIPDGSFAAFGSGKWERAYLPVKPGVHLFKSTVKFGLSAYGWSGAVSYGYPGGLDLTAK